MLAGGPPGPAPLRVGLIGTGRRALGNFLPVLSLMRDQFRIEWIHSRTWERLSKVAGDWGVEPLADLDERALDRIDVAVVTVPIDQNPVVLRTLAPSADRLTLVIDTPIASSVTGALTCARLLSRFRQVLVAEDYMNFPEFELIRRSVAADTIGAIRDVHLDGLGYRYHGLALIRSFAGFDLVRSTRRIRTGDQASTVHYQLRQGMSGCVVGPYRRDSGTVTVTGERGTISSRPDITPASDGYALTFERRDGIIAAAVLRSAGGSRRLKLPEIAMLRELTPGDRSDLNLRRSWGLAQVFGAVRADNLNRRYGFRNALCDSIISRAAEKLPGIFDPLTSAGTGLVRMLLSAPR